MPKILQINYKFSGSWQQVQQEFLPDAPAIAEVPGLRWKIWLVDEARSAGGGIHLFDGDASVQAYLEGPVVAGLQSEPGISEIDVQVFDVAEELSAATRGPFRTPVGA